MHVYTYTTFLRAKKSPDYYAPPGSLDYVLPDGTIVLGDWHNGESERCETFNPFPRIGKSAKEQVKAIRSNMHHVLFRLREVCHGSLTMTEKLVLKPKLFM